MFYMLASFVTPDASNEEFIMLYVFKQMRIPNVKHDLLLNVNANRVNAEGTDKSDASN